MSSEAFKIAKEINSLTQTKAQIQDAITEEERRVLFIESNRTERSEELAENESKLKELKSKIQDTENEISKFQGQLEKDKIAFNSVTSNQQLESLERSIAHSKESLDELENKGLELLEEQENIEIEIQEAQSFLKGSLESLNEIKDEVQSFRSKKEKEVSQLENRIKLLLDELPPLFQDKIQGVIAKNIPKSSFTRIKDGCCEFCRFSLSKIDISNIEDNLALKTCGQCNRIFMPQQVFH